MRHGLTLVPCGYYISHSQHKSRQIPPNRKSGSRKSASSKYVDKGSCHETEESCSKEFAVVFLDRLYAVWLMSAEKILQVCIFPV